MIRKYVAIMCVCVAVGIISRGGEKVREASFHEAGARDSQEQKNTSASNSLGFFPVSVWYSGGKARAPMLEEINEDSPRRWKVDLLKIKGLGFNTVRTWVEWNVGEPREGEYYLENLDLLLRLANDVGLKVIVQVYVDSAPEWVDRSFATGCGSFWITNSSCATTP